MSSHQFRKGTESLDQMLKGYELLKVKLFMSSSVCVLYIHIFLVSLLLLYETQPEKGLCLVLCSEAN